MKLLSADSFNKDNNVYVFGLKFLFFTSKCNIFFNIKNPYSPDVMNFQLQYIHSSETVGKSALITRAVTRTDCSACTITLC